MRKLTQKISNTQRAEQNASPAQIIEKIEQKCRKCTVLTPITCATKCETWKIKREFRKLYEIMKSSNYVVNLLNALKNKRRLHVLKLLSNYKLSLAEIQQMLKISGYNHSQETIAKEYIASLMNVGLIEQQGKRYHATIFGSEIDKIIGDSKEIAEVFPAHSKCYEEIALSILMKKPRTYNELKQFIPSKTVARVLQRLQKAKLIHTPRERDYIFYFKTRRDPSKLEFSPTERKIYENVPEEGIPARKLAEKTGISVRRTYKYLKRLKRRKLVFSRKKPKTYALTDKGFNIAITLIAIRKLVADFLAAAAMLTRDENLLEKLMPDTKRRRKRKEENLPLTVIAHIG